MIIDLRDYTTTPGERDRLIAACEGIFFPEQERLGATILGSFRDADDPDRFVWLRSMPDMGTRLRVLTAFYTEGAMWKEHRDEVNAWIADSDNVLLVRPAGEFGRPATGESVVGMYTRLGKTPLPPGATPPREIPDAIAASGGRMLATLVTDPVANNYARHAIRTGEHGYVWLATFPERSAIEGRRLLPTERSKLR